MNHWFSSSASRWLLLGAAGLVLAGCERQDIKVYQVAKETPAAKSPQVAHNHDDPHGMAGGQRQLTFTLPDGWKQKPAGQMRAAQFAVPGADGLEADVSVIPFPGVSATREDIINIWREQLKLPPADKAAADKQVQVVPIGSEQGDLYELASTELLVQDKYKMRILVGVMARGDTQWFFKMTGPDDLVRASRPAFLAFLKSVGFTAAAMETATTAPPSPGVGETQKPKWQAPAHWKEVPPGPMLTAKYSITGEGGKQAEVTISSLGGDGGGVLPNLNRWRGQLMLQPVGAEEAGKLGAVMDIGGNKATLYDLKGTSAKTGDAARMVVISVATGGQTWFYKLLGDEAVVEKEKAAFLNVARGPN